jgi:Domain of unknown function (DUF5666)
MRRHSRSFLVFAAALVLTACGGGGGSSMSSGNSGNASGAALTTSGSISAFGSVFINGNHFNVSGATITIDDNTANELDLRVGQSAEVRGTAAVGTALAMATSVEVHSRVVGPVASVANATSTFVVLGQTVKVNSETTFDTVITPADITGIHANDLVRVHGVVQADGSIIARRIDRATAAEGDRVSGTVASVNTTTHTFKINALTVDYTSATLANFTGADPANGDVVRVAGTSFNATTTTLTATRVARVAERADAGMVEREGIVTRFLSLTDFDIGGKKVTTTSATVYRNGSSADVKLNAELEASGTVDGTGLLTAQVIEIHQHTAYALEAPITAVTPGTPNTITVMGITVAINARTRLEDRSPARIRNLAFADLRTGDNVAVFGFEDPAGSGKLTARRLERIGTTTATAIAGFFTATLAPQFKVLGVTINTTNTTTFYVNRDTTLTSANFFTQAVGKRVAVIGTGTSPLVASKVLLLLDDDDVPDID